MANGSGKEERAAASWFPGHMAAGLRALQATASLIDIVLEVRDARLPHATAVASKHRHLKSKPLIVLLNREDLADLHATRAWLSLLSRSGVTALSCTGTRASSLRLVRAALTASNPRQLKTRVAVVGAPNTGKSSVINALVRRKRAQVQDKAGVTKHVRWIALDERTDILDTPGVLEPRITESTAWRLSLCGILPESAFDPEEAVEKFGAWLAAQSPRAQQTVTLESFARRRGMLRPGGGIDRPNAARAFLKEFRAGRFGRFTLESVGKSA